MILLLFLLLGILFIVFGIWNRKKTSGKVLVGLGVLLIGFIIILFIILGTGIIVD